MPIRIQGVELAQSAKEVKLPADAILIETNGLPEVEIDATRYLASTKGDLYRRVVNTSAHQAIGEKLAKPKKKR